MLNASLRCMPIYSSSRVFPFAFPQSHSHCGSTTQLREICILIRSVSKNFTKYFKVKKVNLLQTLVAGYWPALSPQLLHTYDAHQCVTWQIVITTLRETDLNGLYALSWVWPWRLVLFVCFRSVSGGLISFLLLFCIGYYFLEPQCFSFATSSLFRS